ncbi:cuticle protein 65-like [Neodiprion virginianus]|uniref:cuticle protein 65-like n=1 Tax=Neodiprion fabricii TaxID=2872261 RepID=UPI001ED96947|nr:cuticle protein 65-like [Neodiprion fabricii]XP_046616359.1 cuticle protein 65-like [Neodiprion virginianus]
MNALTFVAIVALASAVCGEDSKAPKKQDKRGVLGLGYGGYGGHGLHGGLALGGYGYSGLGHGYVAAPAYTVDHTIAAPVAVSHGAHSISSGPILSAPIRVGYEHGLGYSGHNLGYSGHGLGYSGFGLGHGLAYGHGW